MDFFGGKRASTEEALQFEEHVAAAEDDRIIFLSDVWLDKPATHDRLRAIFDGKHCTHACAIYPCALIFQVVQPVHTDASVAMSRSVAGQACHA